MTYTQPILDITLTVSDVKSIRHSIRAPTGSVVCCYMLEQRNPYIQVARFIRVTLLLLMILLTKQLTPDGYDFHEGWSLRLREIR